MTVGKNRTIWSEHFRVRAYEAGSDGTLRPDVLCDYLQETAANHAVALGVGSDFLGSTGLVWVLSRLVVDIERLPRWTEQVAVETWPSGVQGIFATRDFEVTSASGVVARATTAWFLIDMARRRPARLPEAVTGIVLPERPRAVVDDFARLPPFEDDPASEQHAVRPSEIDLNGHVNHVRYLSWALDSTEPDWLAGHRLRRIQIQFRSEARLGDRVRIAGQYSGDSAFGIIHGIRDDAGQVIAQARTDWLPR